jgi:hypothetical protein
METQPKSPIERMIERLIMDEVQTDNSRAMRKAYDPVLTTVMDSVSIRRKLADRFINQVVDESRLLQMVTTMPVVEPSGEFSKINVNTQVTELATENADSGNVRRPEDTPLFFQTVKLRSAMDVTGEWIEDNIEGAQGRSTFVQAMTSAISNDHEQLAIEGDESIVGTTDEERLLKANDGWATITAGHPDTNFVDAGGRKPSFALFSAMLTAMPTKYKRDRTKLRWIMSWGAAQRYVEEIADRPTIYGDHLREHGTLPPILGVPVEIVPLLPEDLPLSGTSGEQGTFIWLTDPKNFVYVPQRSFTLEWERKPRNDRYEMTIYMRTDYIVQETKQVVMATDVSVHTPHLYYGESSG